MRGCIHGLGSAAVRSPPTGDDGSGATLLSNPYLFSSMGMLILNTISANIAMCGASCLLPGSRVRNGAPTELRSETA
jgi:hypothetical protein